MDLGRLFQAIGAAMPIFLMLFGITLIACSAVGLKREFHALGASIAGEVDKLIRLWKESRR